MTGIVQASYGLNHNPAFVGMVADGQLANIISKLNTDVVTIPYGKAVFADGVGGAKLPTSGSTAPQFVGVAVRELNRAYGINDTFGAVANDDFSVLTVGAIWVKAAEAVTARGDVFVRVGATGTGDFAAGAGAAATLAVQIPGAKYLTSAAAGALVKVSFVVGG
ncbi:MAG: structural cement protein Gp24 [Plesiomonas sp.]